MQTGPRAWIAEFIGTLSLIFIGSMSAAVAFEVLDGGAAGVVLAGLAHGLIVLAMVYALGAVSGCHINPAVTIALTAIGKFPIRAALWFISAQLGGAVVGALLHSWIRAKGTTQYGLPLPGNGATEAQALLLEAVLTFFLVTVVVGTAVSSKASRGFHGLAIGLTILASWLVGGALTGAALNPARSFGPMLVSLNFDSWWVYWVGPIAGGLVAALAGSFIHNLRNDGDSA